jgi:L-asparaginase
MRQIALLTLSVIAVILLSPSPLTAKTQFDHRESENKKPRVVILATGGTIAGSASSSTQASYKPGVLSIEQILKTVPEIETLAQLKGIQISNIASQDMEEGIWLELWRTIDNLFTHDLCDGVVITHGTDTMEESAYFLNLTIRHAKPVVITGAMRASTSLSPDGPFNLFNAVALAASANAQNRGVMVVMNDYILSADDVTKTNTINTNAFECPNFGPLGYMRDGTPHFFRESRYTHTASSIFNIKGLTSLPKTEIVYAYAFSSDIAINALIDGSTEGIVIAGVGHGNYNKAIAEAMKKGSSKGVNFVRSSRIIGGGIDLSAENYDSRWPVSFNKTPQKARILLMLALTVTKEPKEIQNIFMDY